MSTYSDDMKAASKKVYIIDGKKFDSITAIAESYNIAFNTALRWVKKKRTAGNSFIRTAIITVE